MVTQVLHSLPAEQAVQADGVQRKYQEVANALTLRILAGEYELGERLPSERDLSLEFECSRSTVREAMIALEVQGLAEIRLGSGAYVRQKKQIDAAPGMDITAFELTEARYLIEGEAAGLAATEITDAELDDLQRIVHAIEQENQAPSGRDEADRAFHIGIAKASRNRALLLCIEMMWSLRTTSPACARLLEIARTAGDKPVVAEHQAVIDALRTRKPSLAREGMRNHLSAVLEHLLFATEAEAIEPVREQTRVHRNRLSAAVQL